MLISHKHKFIFFHLPKAAGSSVELALRKFSHIPYSRLYNYMIDYLGEQKSLNLYERHMMPRDLEKIKPLLFKSDYLKFAVVRNTWDWHCSQFYFHKNTPKTIFHNELKDLSFSEYLDWACVEENIRRANSRQKDYLSNDEGRLLVDKYLRFENLEEEFQGLCRELSITATLPNTNRSPRKRNYRDEYSPSDKKKIEAAHSEDVEFFAFEF